MMQQLQTWRFRKAGPMQLISLFICTKVWHAVSFVKPRHVTPPPWNLMWFGRSQHQAHYPASLFLQFSEVSISSRRFLEFLVPGIFGILRVFPNKQTNFWKNVITCKIMSCHFRASLAFAEKTPLIVQTRLRALINLYWNCKTARVPLKGFPVASGD